ncbi:MAG: hypothetical protein DRO99_05155 [Candidatus Aenigmatarchaeota archaeon]|nr:MAG: hypothetical protein DRO99_05155 [Candidatus Aenigmarchaeota archaeon]
MDEKQKKLAENRLKDGWIKSTMIIEVLAVNKEAAESALKKHVEKIHHEENTMVLHERYHDTREVKNPVPNIESGFSQIVDVDILTRDFDQLVRVVVSYAPSSIEILEPEEIRLDMGEAQGILNSIAELIHKFAAAGLGGVMVSS